MLNARLDRLDDYLTELQRQEGTGSNEQQGAP
jgi:hypothetical protein